MEPAESVEAGQQSATAKVTAATQEGFKIVKVRKPDGSIVKVRRKVTAPSKSEAASTAPDIEVSQNLSDDASKAAKSQSNESIPLKRLTPTIPRSGNTKHVKAVGAVAKVSGEEPMIKPSSSVSTQESPVVGPETTALHGKPNVSIYPAGKNRLQLGRFRRLAQRGLSHTFGSLYPDWHTLDDDDGTGEADEVLSDDDNSDVSEDPDRDDSHKDQSNKTSQTSRNNGVTNTLDASEKYQDQNSTEEDYRSSNMVDQNKGSKHVAKYIAGILAHLTPQSLRKNDPSVERCGARTSTGLKEKNGKGIEVQVDEKRADADNGSGTIKPQHRAARVLPQPYLLTKIIVWTITICLPAFFIALGVACAVLDGNPSGSYYSPNQKISYFNQALTVAITSWPIVFAAIVAQSLKALSSYKLERGIRILTLEQLIGSNSVAGTVKQPFSLRRLDFTSITLLFLWALSPLASQAMQRMSDIVIQSPSRDTTLRIVDTTTSNNNLNPNVSLAAYRNSISSMFGAAILPRGQQDLPYMDPWGYPLVPAVHLLAQTETPQPDNWYPMNLDDLSSIDVSTYSSTLGIPYTPFDDNTETYSFFIQSSYFNFTCSDIDTATIDEIEASTGAQFIQSETETLYMDMHIPQQNMDGNLTFASLISQAVTDMNGTIYKTNGNFSFSTCNFTQLFVESNTTCSNFPGYTDCSITAARLTSPPPNMPQLQPFHQVFIDAGTAPIIPGISRANTPTIIERYLADPTKVLHEMTDINLPVQLNDTDTLERRIGRLFNTFWQAAFDPMYQTGFNETPDDIKLHLNFTNGQNHHNVSTLLLNATVSVDTEFFIAYKPWLALELVCSVLLLIAGIAGLIWEAQTIGPNVLGFANNVVRQNKYVRLPGDSSAMSAPERERRMRDVVVMVQDVKPDAEVGKIVLGTFSDSSRRLEAGRMYG